MASAIDPKKDYSGKKGRMEAVFFNTEEREVFPDNVVLYVHGCRAIDSW